MQQDLTPSQLGVCIIRGGVSVRAPIGSVGIGVGARSNERGHLQDVLGLSCAV